MAGGGSPCVHSLLRQSLAAALAAGCAATVSADAYGPDLVTVSPGVQVIADYDEPIFYSDGFYWRYYGGIWYRSNYYTGGWVYARPPVAVLRIDRPYAYRALSPGGLGRPPAHRSRAAGRGYVAPAPTARLSRHPAGGVPRRPAAAYRAAPAPAYRGAPPRRRTAAHRRRSPVRPARAARGAPRARPHSTAAGAAIDDVSGVRATDVVA